MKTLIHAQRELWNNAIALHFAQRNERGDLAIARPCVWETVPEGSVSVDAALQLRPEDAQLLMDELWNCGLRPSEGTGSAGSLAATERHLKDMQAIAKGLLRKSGVEA